MAPTQTTATASVAAQDQLAELLDFSKIPGKIIDTCNDFLGLLDRPYEEGLEYQTWKHLGFRRVGSALMNLREAGYSPNEVCTETVRLPSRANFMALQVRNYQKASKRLNKIATAWIHARKKEASSDAKATWEQLEKKNERVLQ
jgi:hypothetical protein